MSGGKPSPAKKRKAPAAAAAAAAGTKKLSAGVGALLARLEATNAGFLEASAQQTVAAQLKAQQSAAARVMAEELAAKATSPSLASLPVDKAELARRAERRARFQVRSWECLPAKWFTVPRRMVGYGNVASSCCRHALARQHASPYPCMLVTAPHGRKSRQLRRLRRVSR